jgi:hypothetical protein
MEETDTRHICQHGRQKTRCINCVTGKPDPKPPVFPK